MVTNLVDFTDVLGDVNEIENSQPLSLPSSADSSCQGIIHLKAIDTGQKAIRPARHTGQHGEFRSIEEIDPKYRDVFTYPYFNLVQSRVIDNALYSDKSMVICAPTGSGKTVIFEMAIVQLLMQLDDQNYNGDFKIIYMAPVKALCTERLSEWYPKFTKLGLMCIEVTGDTNVDFSKLKPYRIIITTPEKWDMLTRRWRDHRALVEVIKLFLIDEVHILNDDTRGPVLEAVVSRMKTIESSCQSAHRIEQLQKQYQSDLQTSVESSPPMSIRFVAVSATISNPEDVAAWLGTSEKPAVYYKFGDECRPVKLKRVVEGYPCSEGTSIFKFDIILNYKLWPVIQKYHNGKPTLIFCNTRKSVALTAETLSRELTISFTHEQKARLTALASTIKNKKLQALLLSGVGCHHAGLLFEERVNIEEAFRKRDLPILITTTTLAMGVNLPAHLVIIKNTQHYLNGAYQEYSISTVLQMVGRAGRPQFDTEATAVIMTRLQDKARYQALVGGDEPLQSYLHKRLAENLNSEAALGTVCDVAQCVQWLRSTFLSVRAPKDPKRYLGLPQNASAALISKKIEELCVKAMNGLASAGLITMDEASCIESTEAGRLMSIFYLDVETMKHIMRIEGTESLEKLLWIVCESHELADMHLRVDERRTLNTLNRNNAAATIRFPMKGKISTRQMKLNCTIQAILGCLPIPDPSLNQEAMKVMRIADRVCKCLVAYVTRPELISGQPQYFSAVLNSVTLAKCIEAHLWENSPYMSKQLKGIGPTFSTLLATAGKVNFTLLEESHPRDLERIMNKGAPAGNTLRKQVSLLPKYQLTATPIDEKKITIQLMLLNQNQLAENRDNLTAGDSHKCYVVVGDSENYLLLFSSFKDRDLISVYDGVITYEITRKHSFEHKILIHCISSNWVGLDVHCEYVFKNIESTFRQDEALNLNSIRETPRRTTERQTTITDVYKERKRKNNDASFSESKEKKKRDLALVEKFKHLKNSFEMTSKELKKDLDRTAQMSNLIINKMTKPVDKPLDKQATWIDNQLHEDTFEHKDKALPAINIDIRKPEASRTPTAKYYPEIDIEDLDDEDKFVVDDQINTILSEIESEIHKKFKNIDSTNEATNIHKSTCLTKPLQENHKYNAKTTIINNNSLSKLYDYSVAKNESKRKASTRSNYSFIERLEKNVEEIEDEIIPRKDTGFSDTIKRQIEKFLQKTNKNTKQEDITIKELVGTTHSTEELESNNSLGILPNEIHYINPSTESCASLSQEQTPVDIAKSEPNKNNTTEYGYDVIQSNTLATCNSIEMILEEIEREYTNIPVIDLTHNELDKVPVNKRDDEIVLIESIDNKGSEVPTKYSNAHVTTSDILLQIDQAISNLERAPYTEDIKTQELKAQTNKEQKEQATTTGTNSDTKYVALMDCEFNLQTENNVCNGNLEKNIENDIKNNMPELNRNCDEENAEMMSAIVKYNNALKQPYKSTNNLLTPTLKITDSLDKVLSNKTAMTEYLYKPVIPKGLTFEKQIAKNIVLDKTRSHSRVTDLSNTASFEGSNELNKIHDKYTSTVSQTKLISGLLEQNKVCASLNTLDAGLILHDADENRKSDEHVNRYYFSATKFDVHTKTMPDHEVRIIKKLKLDVDVTEIISQRNTYTEKDKINRETARVDEFKQIKWTKPEIQDKLSTKFGSMSNSPIACSSKSNMLTLENKVNYEKKYLTDAEVTVNRKEEMVSDNKSVQEIMPRSGSMARSRCSKVQQIRNTSDKASAMPETNTKNVNEANCEVATIGSTEQIKPLGESSNKTKIENVLQKYSQILGKNKNMFNNEDIVKTNENKEIISQDSIEKPTIKKKPFKIAEISTLTLPKNIISAEASRALKLSKNDILTRIRNLEQCANKVSQQDAVELAPDLTGNTQNEVIVHDLPDNSATEYVSPDPDICQQELEDNFDLDHSLLNPKTLLEQCFTLEGNDEIIPPPSEFCDNEADYSPRLQEDFDVDLTRHDYHEPEQDEILSKYNHDKSIFEDSPSVLTPSAEIETWTLENDETEKLFDMRGCSPFTSYSSCTVLRRNPPVNINSSLELNSRSRQSKLNYFKFMKKKKFKL